MCKTLLFVPVYHKKKTYQTLLSNANYKSHVLIQLFQSIFNYQLPNDPSLPLRASAPIDISETEEVSVHNERGIWSNKAEVQAWRGDLPITEYTLHHDPNPLVITKKTKQDVEYVQELAIRYLRPPTPPAPGEVLIVQMANIKTGGMIFFRFCISF